MGRIRRETYQDGRFTVDEIDVPDELLHEQELHVRADGALTDLRVLAQSTGTLSSAQLSAAVRTVARLLLTLTRLQLRRFDGTD